MLTNDVETLAPGEARYAALLTPQGKILFDFLVVAAPGEPARPSRSTAPPRRRRDLARRLGFYKLRAKVAIADESAARGVVAYWGERRRSPAEARRLSPTRATPRLGWRAILPRAEADRVGDGEPGRYEALRIAAGAPKGGVDFAYGDAFPHDANIDLLNGVDFDKGCYVGQEVVSRMRHRGERAQARRARQARRRRRRRRGAPVAGRRAAGRRARRGVRRARRWRCCRLDRVEEAQRGRAAADRRRDRARPRR